MYHKRFPRLLFVAIVPLLIFAVACDQEDERAAEVRTIVDSVEREVDIPTSVNRVVCLNSDLAEVVVALGAKDKLVSAGYRVSTGEAWLGTAFPSLQELPSPHTPGGINVEEVLSLEPDLIVTTIFGEVGYEEVLDVLGSLDIPILVLSLEGLDNYGAELRSIAAALGVESKGEELIAFLEETLDSVSSRTQDIPEGDRVRVYHGLWDVYVATSGGIFEDDQIKVAGGTNVSASLTDFGTEVSAEQLIVWNPEVIVTLAEAPAPQVLSDPKLSDIQAVKTGRVYSHPEVGWGFATPRAIFATLWLATKLYPETFSDVDLDAEVDEFYETVYGVSYDGVTLR